MAESALSSLSVKNADWRGLIRVDGPGGEKYLAVSKVLDIIQKRSMLVADRISRPGLKMRETEFLRGQISELQILQRALTEQVPGSDGPNF